MTDQIPADKVRDLRDQYARLIEDAGTKETQAYYGHVVKDLDALLPAPPRPTMADMTAEERAACRWMQADVDGTTRRWLILNPYNEDGDVEVVLESGWKEYFFPERVTPRPDLPRMEWPGEAPVPESTLAVGSMWHDADALTRACRESERDQIIALDRDGDAYIWPEAAEWWEGSGPLAVDAPFTIIHSGKNADQ